MNGKDITNYFKTQETKRNMESKENIRMAAMAAGFKEYDKPATQLMRKWEDGMDTSAVSISISDAANGSPRQGDYIAVSSTNSEDMWLVSAEFFSNNYVSADGEEVIEEVAEIKEELEEILPNNADLKSSHPHLEKTLHNSNASGASKNVKDIIFWGNGDTFRLVSKASSKEEGWMKSTKAMVTGNGVVVQVTTQQRNPDGSYSIAEALTYVPGATLFETTDNESKEVVSRHVWTEPTETTPAAK